MPTLTRLLIAVLLIAALAYGALVTLVALEKPVPREIVVPVELPKPAK